MKTNILIEGTKLSSDIASGISNYIVSLAENFEKHEHKFNINTKLVVLGHSYTQNIYVANSSLSKTKFISFNGFQFYKLLLFGPASSIQLFHSPYMYILLTKRKGCINVLTIHDVINLEKSFSLRNKLREWMLRISIKKADHFICISETTKEKFKHHYPTISESQITTIYQGIDPIFMSNDEDLIDSQLVPKSYLLYVGKRDGYKNFKALLPFMASNKCQQNISLICVGGGKFSDRELSDLKEFNLEQRVRHFGYAENKLLKNLYKNAIALVYTSLYEGFGLPIIEAMASECPVICGNFSSMKEIAKGYAIALHEFSIQSLSDGVDKAKEMDENQLKKIKCYAQTISWENTALQTLTLYSHLLEARF